MGKNSAEKEKEKPPPPKGGSLQPQCHSTILLFFTLA